MSLAQRFAQVVGGIYLMVGILGFTLPLLLFSLPGGVGGPFAGYLVSLFVVNWHHSLAHLLIGMGGLATYRNSTTASIYTLAVGVTFAMLLIVGITFHLLFGGLLPLKVWDHAVHPLTALIAFGAYFASREEPATSSRL